MCFRKSGHKSMGLPFDFEIGVRDGKEEEQRREGHGVGGIMGLTPSIVQPCQC